MHTITTIGLDIAKSVFQVHGIDAQGKVIIRRQLKRRYVLAFFFAASLSAAMYWRSSRSFRRASLELKPAPPVIIGRANSRLLGHTVRHLPPAYAKPHGRLAVLSR
jgi:transposase